MMKIDGRFWLDKNGESFLGRGRVVLLKTIDKTGSIHSAAKELGMSYKAAWDRIDIMNRLADEELLVRTVGGKRGGGTTLTPYAHELIATFERLESVHRTFIERFAKAGSDAEYLEQILSRAFLTTSARNQLLCTIKSLDLKGIECNITLVLPNGKTLQASITTASAKSMALKEGRKVYALIKSNDVIIVDQTDKPNHFDGVVSSTVDGTNSQEIAVDLSGLDLVLVSQASSLKAGERVSLYVDPKSIIIGV